MTVTEFDELFEETKSALEKRKLVAEIQSHEAARDLTDLKYQVLRQETEEQASYNSENRVYTLTGGIGTQDYFHCTNTIASWARQSKKPITVIINSPGGYITEGLAIYDCVQAFKKSHGIKFTTVAIGEAASMAGVLLQLGDRRIMTPRSWLLIHEASGGAIGKTSEIKDDLKFQERLQDQLLEILAEKSTLSKAQIKKKWIKKDWWLSAQEAQKLGFCDEVTERYA